MNIEWQWVRVYAMGKQIVSPILDGQVMYFFAKCDQL